MIRDENSESEMIEDAHSMRNAVDVNWYDTESLLTDFLTETEEEFTGTVVEELDVFSVGRGSCVIPDTIDGEYTGDVMDTEECGPSSSGRGTYLPFIPDSVRNSAQRFVFPDLISPQDYTPDPFSCRERVLSEELHFQAEQQIQLFDSLNRSTGTWARNKVPKEEIEQRRVIEMDEQANLTSIKLQELEIRNQMKSSQQEKLFIDLRERESMISMSRKVVEVLTFDMMRCEAQRLEAEQRREMELGAFRGLLALVDQKNSEMAEIRESQMNTMKHRFSEMYAFFNDRAKSEALRAREQDIINWISDVKSCGNANTSTTVLPRAQAHLARNSSPLPSPQSPSSRPIRSAVPAACSGTYSPRGAPSSRDIAQKSSTPGRSRSMSRPRNATIRSDR